MSVETKLLRAGDEAVFVCVAPEVFDHPIDEVLVSEFLNDPRHHIAVAIDAGCVVGFVSAVHYVHPDKQPQLWINEVGVAPAYRLRGLAKQLMQIVFDVGRSHGCVEAWVATSRSNTAAMQLYTSVGKGQAEAEDFVMFTFPLKRE
jgi:GNAT superfamily N-acetyltransferase